MQKVRSQVCYFVSPAKEAIYINGILKVESFSIRQWRNVFKYFDIEAIEVDTYERVRNYPLALSDIYDSKTRVVRVKDEQKSVTSGGYVGAPWL